MLVSYGIERETGGVGKRNMQGASPSLNKATIRGSFSGVSLGLWLTYPRFFALRTKHNLTNQNFYRESLKNQKNALGY